MTGDSPAPGGRPEWDGDIENAAWAVYRRAIEAAYAHGVEFALGGAFAVATYTGRWRDTKDLDFYVRPDQAPTLIEALTSLGLRDYYDTEPYDREWIYRAAGGDVLVDVIWAMANQRALVDAGWLQQGPLVRLRDIYVRVLPAEELIWIKLYVLQRERCDWPDVFNLLYGAGERLDWARLLDRLDEDAPLLAGALAVFAWLCPGRAQAWPPWLWERVRLAPPLELAAPEVEREHVRRLDTRPWFGPGRGGQAA